MLFLISAINALTWRQTDYFYAKSPAKYTAVISSDLF